MASSNRCKLNEDSACPLSNSQLEMALVIWMTRYVVVNLNFEFELKVSSYDRTTTRRKMIKTTKRMKRRMMTMPVLVTTTALAMEQI